jgi:Uma2 family endonuclease
LLENIPWALYETLREEESNWNVRMTYDAGVLELMSPSQNHGEIEWRFGLFLMEVTRALGLKCKPLGNMTWKKVGEKKAKEADGAYYLTNFDRVRHKKIDLEVDPPPDLAVEAEVSRSAIDALGVYAAIGVPEIWRFDGKILRIHLRQPDGSYQESDRSRVLPFLLAEEVVFWLTKAEEDDDDTEWIQQVNAWARAELAPRLEEH